MSALKTLDLKYRPRKIDHLIGQDHIRKILNGVLNRFAKTGVINRLFLFWGAHGSGKTSAARILARYLNCEKLGPLDSCGECDSCAEIELGTSSSVIEIDAASNRGIDDVKALQASLKFKVAGRARVIILDECHALTKDASGALLKVLEEGNPQDIFVLCTTEFFQVLETIVSRAVPLQISTIPEKELVDHLSFVANQEQIKVSEEALRTIVSVTNCHARDAIKLLETTSLYSGGKEIKASSVLSCSGYSSMKEARDFIRVFITKSYDGLIELCKNSSGDPIRLIGTILKVLALELDKVCSGMKSSLGEEIELTTLVELNNLFLIAKSHFSKSNFSIFVLTYFLHAWDKDNPFLYLERIR